MLLHAQLLPSKYYYEETGVHETFDALYSFNEATLKTVMMALLKLCNMKGMTCLKRVSRQQSIFILLQKSNKKVDRLVIRGHPTVHWQIYILK